MKTCNGPKSRKCAMKMNFLGKPNFEAFCEKTFENKNKDVILIVEKKILILYQTFFLEK